MFCSNCGKSIIEGSKFCPHCGHSISILEISDHNEKENSSYQEHTSPQPSTEMSAIPPKTNIIWSILSWICFTFFALGCCVFFPTITAGLFLILSIYVLPIKQIRNIRNHIIPMTWLRILIGIMLFVVAVGLYSPTNVDRENQVKSAEESVALTSNQEIQDLTDVDEKQENLPLSDETEESEKTDTIEKVFFMDIVKNVTEYKGKQVETTIPVDYINYEGVIISESLSKSGKHIAIPTCDVSYYDSSSLIKYVTVQGRVKEDSTEIHIIDPVIIFSGENAPSNYLEEKQAYDTMIIQAKVAIREEFINSAQETTYESLRRNPDSNKGQPLKMRVYISEVEVDGFISNGAVWAKLDGKDIVIYDDREVREPRLMEGDTITIYAKGDGLTKIKTYEKGTGLLGSDLGANVVDEREEPSVRMIYTELDDVSKFSAETLTLDEDNYYYKKGAELAEKLNEALSDE